MGTGLADNFVVDGDQSGAAFAIAEQTTPPVDSVASIRVPTVDEAVVQQLKVLLATVLVPRRTGSVIHEHAVIIILFPMLLVFGVHHEDCNEIIKVLEVN